MSMNTIQLWCEFGQTCNLRCLFCYNSDRIIPQKEYSPPHINQLTKIIDIITNECDVSSVHLTGGEITLLDELPAIVDHLSRLNLPTVMSTNGTIFNQNLITVLLTHGVQRFQIPLLGTEQTHNFLTRSDLWRTVISNINLIKKARGEVSIVFVATAINLGEFAEVINMAGTLQITTVIFNVFLPFSGEAKHNTRQLSISDHSAIVDNINATIDLRTKFNITLVIGTTHCEKTDGDNSSFIACQHRHPRCINKLIVDAYGNLRICTQSQNIIGNIISENPKKVIHSALSFLLNQRCSPSI